MHTLNTFYQQQALSLKMNYSASKIKLLGVWMVHQYEALTKIVKFYRHESCAVLSQKKYFLRPRFENYLSRSTRPPKSEPKSSPNTARHLQFSFCFFNEVVMH